MKWLLKPIQFIYCIYAILLFVAFMLLAFPAVIIASFFGPVRGGNAIYRICRIWGALWFPMVGIFHRNIFESPHDREKPYIFVSNHISYLDAAILVKTYKQHIRPLGKEEMSKIPIFGFIYRNAIVTVDRADAEDRARSVTRLKSFLHQGISILIFPEGTFNYTHQPLKSFFDGAFRIAIETQTAIKPVLFLDSYDRMHYRHLFTLTPGISRSVYLEEIQVNGLTLADIPALKEKVYNIMDEKLRACGASWIR